MMKKIVSILIVIILFSMFSICNGQLSIGFSLDYGNPLTFKPDYDFLNSNFVLSGSLQLNMEEYISEKWSLQYGSTAGLLGSSMVYEYPPGDISHGTFYADAYLGLLYRFFHDIYIAGGPGISITRYFENASGTTYARYLPNGDREIFFHYTLNDETENPLGFVHLGIGKNISRYSFILQYRHHFSPNLSGKYVSYDDNISGNVYLKSKLIRLIFLLSLSKNKN